MISHNLYATNEKYYPILYEELSSRPYYQADRLMDFLGLRKAHDVKEYFKTILVPRRGRKVFILIFLYIFLDI